MGKQFLNEHIEVEIFSKRTAMRCAAITIKNKLDSDKTEREVNSYILNKMQGTRDDYIWRYAK